MRYEASGWVKFAEVDVFEEGCDPSSTTSFHGDESFSADTIDGVVRKCMEFVGVENQSDVERDACDEIGRLDISRTENDQGCEPSESELARWRKGEIDLWYVTYTFQVEAVERKPVSLEVVK